MSIYTEILDSPLSSPEQKAAAHKMIDAAKTKTAEPVIAGNFTLPDGPTRTRTDGTTYRSYSSVVVSENYARKLRAKFGRLGQEAGEYAAGERLQSAVGSSDEAGFLEKFPDSQSFWDDAKATLKAMYAKLDAESAAYRLKQAKEKAAPVVESRSVKRVEQPQSSVQDYPPAPALSPAERALALKQLLGK